MEKIIKTVPFFAILITLSLSAFLSIGARPVRAANFSSLSFRGASYTDSIIISSQGNSNLENLSSSFTLEVWVKFNRFITLGNFILARSNPSGTGAPYFWWSNENGAVQTYSWIYGFRNSQNTANKDHFYTSTPTLGTWYHVAVVFDNPANTISLYINGVLAKSDAETDSPFYGSGNLNIGRNLAGSIFLNGELDEFRLWSLARKQEDIQRDMNRALTGRETDLVAYYKFDEGSGCSVYDATPNNLPGNLSPTCSAGDAPTWSTDVPPLNNTSLDLPPYSITNSRGGWLAVGRAVAASGVTVKAVDYSVNGGGWIGATATDGTFNQNGENYEGLFQSSDNSNTNPGYVLEIRATDNTDLVTKRLHFEPFNLSEVKKLNDNRLQFKFNVNQQRDLLKTRLFKYQISYIKDGGNNPVLVDDILADFEMGRSLDKNIASHNQPSDCDPCLYEDDKKIVAYGNNNSEFTVTSKVPFTTGGSFTFKVTALDTDGFTSDSNTVTLGSASGEVKAASTSQVTSASRESAKPQETTIEELGQKKLPGQKANFETQTGGETGPVAAFVNGVISTILGIWEKIISLNF